MGTTTVEHTIRDLQRDDILAFREELASQLPDAPAVVWSSAEEQFAVVDDRGEAVTAAAAVASVDAHIETLTDSWIENHVEMGTEDQARERFGDQRVDDWFRAQGEDPDAMRAGW